jgi:hypothetical protein
MRMTFRWRSAGLRDSVAQGSGLAYLSAKWFNQWPLVHLERGMMGHSGQSLRVTG